MNQSSVVVQALAHRWGQPQVIEEPIKIAPGLSERTVRDFFSDRWGEVVMVIRRTTDGMVWVMTKEGFPQGLYSLPTGGIRHHEPILAALHRELSEETGFVATIEQFLAVIRYRPVLAQENLKPVPSFVSYVFLFEEASGDQPVVSGGEKITDFKAIAPGELLQIARNWRDLSGANSEFHDLAAWGKFRSIAHQIVVDALIGKG